ncbi:hypothetical protein H257_09998 [Aphanomyces astaci]|uniref:Uncharacterized protein n=1 Tax=Aphanomyces astaci TaxID=112090 RepID=W4G972_APHAT|nr:hypothetical protein H257_09998 [Aphanomyces astaci]ETV75579.1 hypothetical protein H257_09998 [Aphanomyces astaci]|eukprot:XP_009834710.1 hypothetical protein H257_09998 [Aphanomyces astaci]
MAERIKVKTPMKKELPKRLARLKAANTVGDFGSLSTEDEASRQEAHVERGHGASTPRTSVAHILGHIRRLQKPPAAFHAMEEDCTVTQSCVGGGCIALLC